jgi:hypothetical protein
LSCQTNLAKLKAEGKVLTREGVIPGDQKKTLPELRNKPFLKASRFPDDVVLWLDAQMIPPWTDPRVHSLHGIANFEEFKNPQLLIKQSFLAKLGRFRAALVRSEDPEWGVVCTQAFVSIRDLADDARHIRAAALVYNSLVAAYYLALTSSRVGHYITETLAKELVMVPLPNVTFDLSSVMTFEQIDELTRRAFSLTKADWTLVEDFLDVTLPDALRKSPGPGRRATTRGDKSHTGPTLESELSAYGKILTRVLKNTFGRDKAVAVTIYQEPNTARLPVRMVTIHLDWPGRAPLTIETIATDRLLDELASFHRDVLAKKARCASGRGLGFQRVAFFFHAQRAGQGRVRNLTIIKPDEYRYWTRSQAMRDADELAAAIMQAGNGRGFGS